MQNLLWQLNDIDALTVCITLLFAAAVFWFIREIVEAPMLALFSVPVLIVGGLIVPSLFRLNATVLSQDQDTNAAATSAVGVLSALILMVTGKWLWVVYKERKTRRAQSEPLQPPTGEPPLAR